MIMEINQSARNATEFALGDPAFRHGVHNPLLKNRSEGKRDALNAKSKADPEPTEAGSPENVHLPIPNG
ncbi:hypothetical protein JKG47_00325 [Acidithiobacillus sp. MC6.1]|nr:hypothetical protein [Acidithiobacillus sp. MC6.1]